MRTETSNTWEEGLVMDLNPLSTPKNVLTDCLNGTFLTYNGNEFNLQNDMGNYKLKYCRLKPNYIPVGVKEFGDILYIVSHNPLNNNVEIGSYPSPLMITTSNDNNVNNELVSIIQQNLNSSTKREWNYTDLMDSSRSILFNGEEFKLNPGDEYCLQSDQTTLPYKYETLEYFILDDEANSHNITDKVELNKNSTIQEYKHVAWTIPGWMSIKPRLVDLGIAGINIRSFYVPKTDSEEKIAYYTFNLRLNVNDRHLIEKGYLDEWCDNINGTLTDIMFRLKIEKNVNDNWVSIFNSKEIEFPISGESNVPSELFLEEAGWMEWYDKSKILWKNISGTIKNIKEDEVIRITITPVLYDKENNYKIIYNNLSKELLFDLKAMEDNIWSAGDSLYQFYVNDSKVQTIYTNIKGPQITSVPVSLYAEIYDLNGNKVVDTFPIEEYTGLGENQFNIPFSGSFVKENIYIIKFIFGHTNTGEEINTISKLLITSEIFNSFTDSTLVYDRDLNLNTWINKYLDKCTHAFNPEVIVRKELASNFSVIRSNNGELTDADNDYLNAKQYGSFLSDTNPGLSDRIECLVGKKYLSYFYENFKLIRPVFGDLWDNFEIKNNFYSIDYVNNREEPLELQSSLGRTNVIVSAYLQSNCEYSKKESPFEFAKANFWRFNDRLIKLPSMQGHDRILSGNITDYIFDAEFKVIGKNADKEDRRTVSCHASLKYKGQDYDASSYNYDPGVIQGKNQRGLFVPFVILNKVFKELHFPFLFVRIKYNLSGTSNIYKIAQTVFGGTDSLKDFTFFREENGSFERYYVAFYDYDTEAPILVPFATENGEQYFSTFCDNMYVALEQILNKSYYDQYILKRGDPISYKPRLTIKNKLKLDTFMYNNVNLFDKSSVKELTDNLTYTFGKVDWSLLTEKDSIGLPDMLLYDRILDEIEFPKDEFPWKSDENIEGMEDILQKISKLETIYKQEYDTMNNSTLNNEPARDGFAISGLYSDKMLLGNTPLFKELNDAWDPINRTFNVDIKSFNSEEGITEDIRSSFAQYTVGQNIWINIATQIVTPGIGGLVHGLLDPGTPLDSWNKYAIWVGYHNENALALESNSVCLFGGYLNSNISNLRMDEQFAWITD